MPVINRTRVRTGPSVSGTRLHRPSNTIATGTVSTGSSTCVDVVGDNGGNHGLNITHRTLRVGTVTGKALAFPVYEYFGYPMTNQSQVNSHAAMTVPTTAAAITQVQAETNPSRPHVSIPNFLFELKDLPGMLLDRGRTLKKKRRGNSVAENNFGWESLGRDLMNMFDFASAVDKRATELTNLYNSGGLQRKRTVFSETVSVFQSNVTLHSLEAFVNSDVTTTTRMRVWASINWRPTAQGMPTRSDVIAHARLLVHGWEFSPYGILSTVWEALPWSWFSDYFFNVGDYLNANRNTAEFRPANPCRMVHGRTQRDVRIKSVTAGFSATTPSSVFETKDRYTGSASLSLVAYQPILAAKRLTTLSSIALGFGA